MIYEGMAASLPPCTAAHAKTYEIHIRRRSLSAKKPLIMGLFCGKRPMKIMARYTNACTTYV